MNSRNCHLIVTNWGLSWIIHSINLHIWLLHSKLCWQKTWYHIKNIDLFYVCSVKTHLWRRMLSGTSMSEAKCFGCAQKWTDTMKWIIYWRPHLFNSSVVICLYLSSFFFFFYYCRELVQRLNCHRSVRPWQAALIHDSVALLPIHPEREGNSARSQWAMSPHYLFSCCLKAKQLLAQEGTNLLAAVVLHGAQWDS